MMEDKTRHHDYSRRKLRQRQHSPHRKCRRSCSRSPHRASEDAVGSSHHHTCSRSWLAHKESNLQYASSSSKQEYSCMHIQKNLEKKTRSSSFGIRHSSRFRLPHRVSKYCGARTSSQHVNNCNEFKGHQLIQSKDLPQECRLCGCQNIAILGSVPVGTSSLILCKLCRWELHDTSLWDPTKWQLLIICQAFESVSQDTATCTATLQDQDETSISSIDGMEHGGVHIIQQTLHSDEGKEHGVQNKDSLMNTGNGLKTSNSTDRRSWSSSPHRPSNYAVGSSQQHAYSRSHKAHASFSSEQEYSCYQYRPNGVSNYRGARTSSQHVSNCNEATHFKGHQLIQSKDLPQECRLCGCQNIAILGSVPYGTSSLIVCKSCRWELHDTSEWDPMKWQLLIKCQAFESDSQDTTTCTATFQDQDEINISSIDGAEYRGVYNIQQPLSSDEGKEHGVQNKHSLMNTGNTTMQMWGKTSNNTESCTYGHSPPQLIYPRREEYKKALNDRPAEHYNQEDTQMYLAYSSQLHNSGPPGKGLATDLLYEHSNVPWKSKEGHTVEKLAKMQTSVKETARITKHHDTKLTSAQLVYSSFEKYKDILLPIICQDAAYQKEAQISETELVIDVSWTGEGEGFFQNPWLENNTYLTVGSRVHLNHIESDYITTGIVCKLLSDTVYITVPSITAERGHHFRAYIEWNPTTFERMKSALKRFATPSCKLIHSIKQMLLGQCTSVEISQSCTPMPKPVQFRGLNRHLLNGSQNKAIQSSLQQSLCLIQGPPGTGKTATAAAIVYNFVMRENRKVLVCAPSNSAVDNLCLMIAKHGLDVVRVSSKVAGNSHLDSYNSRDAKLMAKLLLHHKIKSDPRYEELEGLDGKARRDLERQCEISILKNAQVVCCTCVGAGDRKLFSCRFQMILVDECGQATEPECMIPIVFHGRDKVILIGDHCQLGPVVMDKAAVRAGLQTSLFERLFKCGIKPVQLTTQYRMHPALSKFPSQEFYSNELKDGVKSSDRMAARQFPWPDHNRPTFFWDCTGKEETLTEQSFFNNDEAQCVGKVIDMLLDANVVESRIGVITPYNEQIKMIKWWLPKSSNKKELEIDSVDGFQGREKDYIIFSCVRSNDANKMGFLNDWRRLNVALTRAKRGLIIIGNASLLSQDDHWCNLIHHYNMLGLLVQNDWQMAAQEVLKLPGHISTRSLTRLRTTTN